MHQRQQLPLPQPRAEGAIERIQKLHCCRRQVHDHVLEEGAAAAAPAANAACRGGCLWLLLLLLQLRSSTICLRLPLLLLL